MKSIFFSLLPIAGLTVAEPFCKPKTVTTTAYVTVYDTAKPTTVADATASKPSVCPSRSTVYTTTHEKVYVTVTPDSATPDAVKDTTTTSTTKIYTTVTVRPTGVYYGNFSTSALSKPHVSSNAPPYPTISVAPTAQLNYSSLAYTPIPQSEALKSYEAAQSSSVAAVPTPESKAPTAPNYAAPAPPASKDSSSVDERATSAAGSKTGEATFYGGNVSGGMCSFTGYTIPSGIYGTALSDSNWDNANNCGVCVSVTGPNGNKITAMVVDQCPGCGPNHPDLFSDAFAKLAEPSKGIIPISWDFVSCGITSPIILKNKEGTSRYWFSMQVMNSNVAVSKLEVSTDGGATWKATTRKEYNFFEKQSGFSTDSVDVKITSAGGKSIIVKNVSIAANSRKTADSNFA